MLFRPLTANISYNSAKHLCCSILSLELVGINFSPVNKDKEYRAVQEYLILVYSNLVA